MRRFTLLGLLALAACNSGGVGSTATTGPGATETASATAGSTAADEPTGTTDACMGTNDCDTDGICVADYQAADPPPGGKRGPADCVPKADCIGALDLGRWCFDHRGCCDDLRCRPTDGLCEPATLGQTTGGTEADSTGPTTDGPGTDTTGDPQDTSTTGDPESTTGDPESTGTTGDSTG